MQPLLSVPELIEILDYKMTQVKEMILLDLREHLDLNNQDRHKKVDHKHKDPNNKDLNKDQDPNHLEEDE